MLSVLLRGMVFGDNLSAPRVNYECGQGCDGSGGPFHNRSYWCRWGCGAIQRWIEIGFGDDRDRSAQIWGCHTIRK